MTKEAIHTDSNARFGGEVEFNLGTHARIPDIPGLATAKPLTNVEALELDRYPTTWS